MTETPAQEAARRLYAEVTRASIYEDRQAMIERALFAYGSIREREGLERAARKLEGYGDVVGAMAIRALMEVPDGK